MAATRPSMQEPKDSPISEDGAHRVSVAYLIPLEEPETAAPLAQWSARVLRYKLLIVVAAAIALAIAIAYLLVAPRIYRVEVALEPTRQTGFRPNGVTALLGEDIGS